MHLKKLKIIFVLFVIGLVLYFIFKPNENLDQEVGEVIFPKLSVVDFKKIKIITKNNNIVLLREEDKWYVELNDEFKILADLLRLQDLTNSIENMHVIRKVSDEKKSVIDENSPVIEVELLNKEKIKLTLGDLIINNNQSSQRYIKFKNQIYLVDKPFLEIDFDKPYLWYKKFIPYMSNCKTVTFQQGFKTGWNISRKSNKEAFKFVKPSNLKNSAEQYRRSFVSMIENSCLLDIKESKHLETYSLLEECTLSFIDFKNNIYELSFHSFDKDYIACTLKVNEDENIEYNFYFLKVYFDEFMKIANFR